jgi:hypothetical protein
MTSNRRRLRSSGSSDDIAESRSTRRRSSRGNSSLSELAKDICMSRKRVVFITGAGISVACKSLGATLVCSFLSVEIFSSVFL